MRIRRDYCWTIGLIPISFFTFLKAVNKVSRFIQVLSIVTDLFNLQSKIRDLEDRLREEAHQRKLVEDKTAEVVSNYHYHNVLLLTVIVS